jgi:hypothetical protein
MDRVGGLEEQIKSAGAWLLGALHEPDTTTVVHVADDLDRSFPMLKACRRRLWGSGALGGLRPTTTLCYVLPFISVCGSASCHRLV